MINMPPKHMMSQLANLMDQYSRVMQKPARNAGTSSTRPGSVYGAGRPILSKWDPNGVMPANPKIARERSKYLTIRSPLTGEVICTPLKRGAKRKPSPGLTQELAKIWVEYAYRVDQAWIARRPVTRLLMGFSMDEHRIFNTTVSVEIYKRAGYTGSRFRP